MYGTTRESCLLQAPPQHRGERGGSPAARFELQSSHFGRVPQAVEIRDAEAPIRSSFEGGVEPVRTGPQWEECTDEDEEAGEEEPQGSPGRTTRQTWEGGAEVCREHREIGVRPVRLG